MVRGGGGRWRVVGGTKWVRLGTTFNQQEQYSTLTLTLGISSVEMDQLEQWVNKYKYEKEYPVVGKLSTPPVRTKGEKINGEGQG